MTEIRVDRDFTSKALLALAAIALAAGLAVYVRPNKPVALTSREKLEQIDMANKDIEAEKSLLEFHRRQVAVYTWNVKQEEIGPLALAGISKLVRNHGLKLITFRPQKAEQEKDLTRVPFLMALEGPYSDVVAFTRDLEKPQSKLALNMIQLNSADGVTDQVSAAINVVAYTTDLPLGGIND
jgi:Tfp pilus assembly protein PilO